MAYNLAQFNRTAFNASSNVKWLNTAFVENITTSIGADNNTYLNTVFNEVVRQVTMSGEPCKFITSSGTETVSEEVTTVTAVIYIETKFSETVNAEVSPSAEIFLTSDMTEAVTGNINLAMDAYLDTTYTEQVNADTILGLNLYLETEGFELITEFTSVLAVEETICYIGTPDNPFTLKPGERLIIDAGTYNLLVNGENAIHYQSGEWLDSMNRNTLSIDIQAASGLANLQASILYTELFL